MVLWTITTAKKVKIQAPKKKILYIAQEIAPYHVESLGDYSSVLPLGMLERGTDIRVFMPNYGSINERRHQLHEVIRLSGVNQTVNDHVYPLIVKVANLMPQRMQVYFIDSAELFSARKEGSVRDGSGEPFKDNAERSVFFLRGVFETIRKLHWVPDIIHCQGWFSGLAPLFLRTQLKDDPAFASAKVVFSLYDKMTEVPFGKNLPGVLKYEEISHPLLTEGTALSRENLYKLILQYVDAIVLSSDEIHSSLKSLVDDAGVKSIEYIPNETPISVIKEFYEELLKQPQTPPDRKKDSNL